MDADDANPPASEAHYRELGKAPTIGPANNGAPEFVIDLDGIVNTQAPGRPLEASRSPSLFAGPHG
jgi:hypothetical protein